MLAALLGLLTALFLDSAKRKALAAAFFAVAAFFLIFAVSYALFALREWIVLTYAPLYPDLWISGGMVVVSLPFILLGVWKQKQPPPPEAYRAAAVLAAPAAARMATRFVSPGLLAVGAVSVLGLWLGRQLGKD